MTPNTLVCAHGHTAENPNIKPKNLKSMMQMKLVLEFKFDYTALDQRKSYKKYIWITLLKFKFEIYMFYKFIKCIFKLLKNVIHYHNIQE